ncbi:acyl-CoA dehydrogenase [Blastococcus goldschmidtiae]|uniref:Acyl-CoA dehydrogenase n=1 Tax=Blastococcus goldschmidtiae TaxID=3075546 RepID=A0ABU2K6W2_9ACTN|nr:acyl-CoA dehydrogenase [Blastococcus sp. DSM 46792]MDT0275934.1 acyl-CoA dehydrogenase [Blastococcus sp. DSM 46792]
MTVLDFAERRLVQESVRDAVEQLASVAHTRALVDHDAGDVREVWRELNTALGLTAIPVPEERGGAGSGWGAVGIVLEELGRTLYPVPYLSSCLALRLLLEADTPAAHELLPRIVSGDDVPAVVFGAAAAGRPQPGPGRGMTAVDRNGEWRVSGRVDDVLGAAHADVLLVAASGPDGPVVLSVAAGAATIRSRPTLDPTRPVDDVVLDQAPATPLTAEPVEALLADVVAFGAAALATEAVGGAARCLDLALQYVRDRRQFGTPIGSFQAVKHACADLLRELEPARSAALGALEVADGGHDADLQATAALAKVVSDRMYTRVSLESVQLHGALGFTWEMELHLHTKRAVCNRVMFGEAPWHRAVLSRQVATLVKRASGPIEHVNEADRNASADLPELRAEVRDWLREHGAHAPPLGGAHEAMSYEQTPEEAAWIDRLREGRWLCLSWPDRFGCRALGPIETMAVNEEFTWAGVPRPHLGMGETLVAPAILAHGSVEQQDEFLPRILSGEHRYCQGFSEPEAGSDLAHLRTRGVVEGDSVRITGEKIWQSGAQHANRIFVLCRTDADAPPHRGISYVLADIPGNGIRVEPIRMMSGDHGFSHVVLDGAVAPLEAVIGGLGNGWKVAMTTLGAERAGQVTSQHLGYQREFEQLVDRLAALDRLDAATLDRLTDPWIGIQLMRLNGRRVAADLAAGLEPQALLAIDKINWSEFHLSLGLLAAELRGLDGVLRPREEGYVLDDLQRVLLESPGRRIARGTNQIQRNLIAERVLGLPR